MTRPPSAQSAERTGRGATSRRRPSQPLLGYALAAARYGLHVFPLRPKSKLPYLHGKRHCPGTGACAEGHQGWEQRATTDLDLIQFWWRRFPQSNIGIACGPSRLYVLDLDAPHGDSPPPEWSGAEHGRDVLARLAERAGEPYPGDT